MSARLRIVLPVFALLLLCACETTVEDASPTAAVQADNEPRPAPTVGPTETSARGEPSASTETPEATALPPTRTPVPAGVMLEVSRLEAFSTIFDEDVGRTRLVLILSTGCSSCLVGTRWLEESVLAANPDADVAVYALWFPMVPGDMLPSELRGQRDEGVLNDPRVIHFWDGQRLANQWLAANVAPEGPERSSLRRTYGQLDWGSYIWDAYFVYEPGAMWDEAAEPAASGYPLIANRRQIRGALGMSATASERSATSGTYRIVQAESFVTYGVQEMFAGRDLNYAIGVTNNITGKIVLDAENPANSEVGPIMVNIRDFSSDNFLRDDRIRMEFLESNRYPLATFRPMAIRGLPETYTPGDTVTFEMDGELEVRDVAVPTTFAVSAGLENGRLTGTATAQILMTDFGFEPPAIAGLIAAENEVDVRLEFVGVRD